MQKKLNGFDYDVFLLGDPYTGALSQPPEFNTAAAFGLVPGYSGIFAFGFNPSISTNTQPEDAWGGDGLYPWMPSPRQLEIVSTSASDSGAAVGARTVAITALDANHAPLVQLVTLNGLTPVQIPLPAFRINGARCLTAGTSDTNVGDLIIRDTAAGATRGIILAGKGGIRQSAYTVPAGNTLAVTWLMMAVDSPTGSVGKFASVAAYIKPYLGASFQPIQVGGTNASTFTHYANPPLAVQEKTDFSLRVMSVSDNNTAVTAAWGGMLRVNT